LIAGEAKNVDNAVVLARLFNEASGQKAPSKKHGLFISRPLGTKKEKRNKGVRGIEHLYSLFFLPPYLGAAAGARLVKG
jgi:hypothetical protein